MEKFRTIHVFSYGECQLITSDMNFKAPIDSFKKLQAVIDDVKSNKPKDVVKKDYHAINIFSGMASYITVDKEASFDVKTSKLDSKKIDALISEFKTLKVADDKAKAEENK